MVGESFLRESQVVGQRPVAVFLTIDETFVNGPASVRDGCSTPFRRSRRILAKVFCRSVLKLAV
jgi:hypothetical protein